MSQLKAKEISVLESILDTTRKEKTSGRGWSARLRKKSLKSGLVALEGTEFERLNLGRDEVLAVAAVFEKVLKGSPEMSFGDILSALNAVLGYRQGYAAIVGLIKKEVLATSSHRHGGGVSLMEQTLTPTPAFYALVEESEQEKVSPYQDNSEFLLDHFRRIDVRADMVAASRSGEPSVRIRSRLESLEERIGRRLQAGERTFPLNDLVEKYQLNQKEELVVLCLLRKYAGFERNKVGDTIDDILEVISDSADEYFENRLLFSPESRLVSEGIVELEEDNEILRHFMRDVCLKENIIDWVLEKGEATDDMRLKRFVQNQGVFEIRTSAVGLAGVILDQKTMGSVQMIVRHVESKALERLHEWGFSSGELIPNSFNETSARAPGLTALFFGPSGTGKTLTALAVGKELDRSLITLDCSKILSAWVGNSEKNVRRLFDDFEKLSKQLEVKPILLLNEVDQFLGERMKAERSVDRMYNQMQNLFLERMEQFEGILIATTNLENNIDEAFSRRFHFKLKFGHPDAEQRLRLWQIHVPKNAPMADDVDFEYLAKKYAFTGGQIALVVNNAAIAAAVEEKTGNRIDQELLIRFCKQELEGNWSESEKDFGFTAN